MIWRHQSANSAQGRHVGNVKTNFMLWTQYILDGLTSKPLEAPELEGEEEERSWKRAACPRGPSARWPVGQRDAVTVSIRVTLDVTADSVQGRVLRGSRLRRVGACSPGGVPALRVPPLPREVGHGPKHENQNLWSRREGRSVFAWCEGCDC